MADNMFIPAIILTFFNVVLFIAFIVYISYLTYSKRVTEIFYLSLLYLGIWMLSCFLSLKLYYYILTNFNEIFLQ